MGLPFLEIIESVTPDPNALMWKFADADKEIKNGAMLTVRESQHALLLNEGQLADVFPAGKYSLETENIPVMTRLRGWKYGFESPFKADIYFFNTHQFINLKWGTPAPVLMLDPVFGQVRIRAFGTYNIRIVDVGRFFKEYAGTWPRLGITELELQLRDFIAPKFGEVLSLAKIPVVDAAGNVPALNEKIQPLIQPYFTDFGLEVTRFTITSITLPEEVLKQYDKVTGMNMVTDMNKFSQYSIANAMDQEGSDLGAGARTGIALGMITNLSTAAAKPAPPEDITERLKKLKALFEAALITEAEYAAKKEELLKLL
ncbi:SPFH domain-containing protein [Chitinophaga arvensicola]|uniref:Membrane protease subunit, stomatin/prohibitin family, contains C-terminal Zn-ribbon domain n=1 Tax=Chitinophaga arvensicola TaxID=29529 RepID=A0A1I0RTN6_9BACT|nr:SPFH domain-containing protein [Chitinophaga arvensicola]SEW44785.1 Membrane protease subunit, stomatin/prohibitin family, contains C-terminal Zn-ribbon domain [Chitinophaga arvensicola]